VIHGGISQHLHGVIIKFIVACGVINRENGFNGKKASEDQGMKIFK
jgi:hypothetical protein